VKFSRAILPRVQFKALDGRSMSISIRTTIAWIMMNVAIRSACLEIRIRLIRPEIRCLHRGGSGASVVSLEIYIL
jgi:hypothetical protein